MWRLCKVSCQFGRVQNFFQMNPIYPDYGEKDFNIYNVQSKTIPALQCYKTLRNRQAIIKRKARDHFLLRKYNLIAKRGHSSSEQIFDDQTGLPLGINSTYDDFIKSFKQNKKVGENVQKQFSNIILKLMKKFKAKSQLQLIRIFRISIAQLRKQSLKDIVRSKLIQQAIIQTKKTPKYFLQRFGDFKDNNEQENIEINEEQVDETAFKEALMQIDTKIQAAQSRLSTQLSANLQIMGQYNHFWQQQDKFYYNNYDKNLQRQFAAYKIQKGRPNHYSIQDYEIQQRISRLFFLRKIQSIKNNRETVQRNYDLPIKLRQGQRIINELAHRYGEQQLLQQPNLQEIYRQIDYAISKVNIRMCADDAVSSNQGRIGDRIFSKSDLLWKNLDVQQVMSHDYYSEQKVSEVQLDEKDIMKLTPSASAQLSLNRVPMNLYRHQQCEIFGVFTKYRHQILAQVVSNKPIDVSSQFNYFSLDEAHQTVKQHKRREDEGDKYRASAKRKKCQAEVVLTQGIGRVTINGKPIRHYFADTYYRTECLKPLIFTETAGQYDVHFQVVGGGSHGQSQCCASALAKVLIKINPDYREILYGFGLVGSDTRAKQAKKIGLYSARVRPPYVRR